jgi:site-specific DNA recombinase
MKFAIYIRVSTEDQAKEGYSLEVQREHLESFAKREGLEIFKLYQDDGISGYSTERPALKELLGDAKDKKFDLVLVYKIDRFSRNLKDLLNLVDELSSCGVGFKSATEPFDTTTSSGKLMFQHLGSFAEFERNRIAEGVFPGMVKGVQQGNWQGARYGPYGYNYNKERKLLETNEEEAKVIKLIYTMFLYDKSIRGITEYLTRKGYRNRKGNIFTTKLIGDILYCARCNHKYLGLTSISNHRTGAKKRWYRCMGPYRSFIRCKNKSVKADEIESEVADILEILPKNDKLKTSRWMNVAGANFPSLTDYATSPKAWPWGVRACARQF